MLIPPALQQPAPIPAPAKAEPGPLARLLATRGAVVSLSRKALGALYGRGTVEMEQLEAAHGADKARGLGLHITGPAKSDGEGRAVVEADELPALLAALDRFAAEAPKLAAGDADTSFSYTSNGGLNLELARERDGVALTLRAGRGEATLSPGQIAALRQLMEKAH
ncbi:MAG: hypothetical protein JST05_04770 [Acidobacteria bacterium]|nr:hypothetical protein [Acidobacteriota bacterium]